MAKKYDMGTPIGAERKMRRTRSPLQEMDDIVGMLDFEEEVRVPTTPIQAQPVIMEGIAAILSSTLDEKLTPVTRSVSRLEEEVGKLKKQVVENEDMMMSNIENVAKRMDAIDKELKQWKVAQADRNESPGTESFTSTPRRESDNYTVVFGGFKGACSKEEVDEWLHDVLWKAGAAYPLDTYVKASDMKEFNGVVFGKYPGHAERDAVIKKVRESKQEYGGQQVWSKMDLPIEMRAAQGLLFAAKNMLVSPDWGLDRRSLWIDTEENVLTCGDEEVLRTKVEGDKLVVEYGKDWETFIVPDNEAWAAIVKAGEEKVAKKPRKGIGKGRPVR